MSRRGPSFGPHSISGVFPHGFQYRWVTLFVVVGLAMANGNMKYTSFFVVGFHNLYQHTVLAAKHFEVFPGPGF